MSWRLCLLYLFPFHQTSLASSSGRSTALDCCSRRTSLQHRLIKARPPEASSAPMRVRTSVTCVSWADSHWVSSRIHQFTVRAACVQWGTQGDVWRVRLDSDWCSRSRNAAVDGYIQQFLYTFRFFCSAEQLLQFIMDKFISAARYRCSGQRLSQQCKYLHQSSDSSETNDCSDWL